MIRSLKKKRKGKALRRVRKREETSSDDSAGEGGVDGGANGSGAVVLSARRKAAKARGRRHTTASTKKTQAPIAAAEEQQPQAAASADATTVKKGSIQKKKKKRKRSKAGTATLGLSFAEEVEAAGSGEGAGGGSGNGGAATGGAGGGPRVVPFKVKKSRLSRHITKHGATRRSGADTGNSSASSAGGSAAATAVNGGRYSADMLAKLRQQQAFAVKVAPSEAAKGASTTAANHAHADRLRAAVREQQEGALGDPDDSDQEGGASLGAAQAAAARAQRERRRQIGSGEYIPLSLDGSATGGGGGGATGGAGAGAGAGGGAATGAGSSLRTLVANSAARDTMEGGEAAEWELEQIRRGQRVAGDAAGSDDAPHGSLPAPGAALPSSLAAGGGSGSQPPLRGRRQSAFSDALHSVASLKELRSKLRSAVEVVEGAVASQSEQAGSLRQERDRAQQGLGGLSTELEIAKGRFNFYAQLKAYVNDLVACIRAKAPLVTGLADALHAAAVARGDAREARRAVDLLDEVREATQGAGAVLVTVGGRLPDQEVAKRSTRSAAERWAARKARRGVGDAGVAATGMPPELARGAAALSVAEDSDSEETSYSARVDELLSAQGFVVADVHADFASLHSILQRFLRWRHLSPKSYTDTWTSLTLPDVLAPWVQLEVATRWRPLDCSASDEAAELEVLPFHGLLADVDQQEAAEHAAAALAHDASASSDANDSSWTDPDADAKARAAAAEGDGTLLPNLVRRVAVPALTRTLGSVAWDPVSVEGQERALSAVQQLLLYVDPGESEAAKTAVEALLAAVLSRLQHVAANIVCVPVLRTKDGGGELARVTRRQWALALQFLRHVVAWRDLLSEEALKEVCVQSVIGSHLEPVVTACLPRQAQSGVPAPGGTHANHVPLADKAAGLLRVSTLLAEIVDCVPHAWLRSGKSGASIRHVARQAAADVIALGAGLATAPGSSGSGVTGPLRRALLALGQHDLAKAIAEAWSV